MPITRAACSRETNPSASLRTVTASAWVPALPPIPAITGPRAASTRIASMVSWKYLMMRAARSAVSRLTDSHGSRLRTALNQPPPNCSSPDPPPNFSKSSVCSASTTSITSSKVTRPSNRPTSSTTGTAATLYRDINRATSSWSRSELATAGVASMMFATGVFGAVQTRRRRGRTPTSL